jgi:predicted permease
MFMNSNSLPVALMQSLATTVPLLKWGTDDTIDAMFGRSLTYLVVFSTLGMIVSHLALRSSRANPVQLRWSYGIRLLSQVDESEPPPTTYRDVDTVTTPLVDDLDPRGRHARRTRTRLPHPRITHVSRRHTLPHGRLHSHLPAVPTSLGDQSESEDTDELETTEADSEDTIALRSEQIDTAFSEAEDHAPAPASEPTPRWSRRVPSFFTRLLATLTSLSPPLVASLLALFCVLVPPVQQALKSDAMTPFKGALDSAGACSVPLTMLVLGGWFWDAETKGSRAEDRGSHDRTHVKSKGKRHTPPPPGHLVETQSRDSSTASLSSMIGAFGDVLMARIHPHRRRVRGTPDTNPTRDVEAGPQMATHTETETENAENGPGHAPRSRSRTDPVNGCARGTNPPGETLTVFVALLARMVLVPIVVTPLMVLVSRQGWGGDVFEEYVACPCLPDARSRAFLARCSSSPACCWSPARPR